MAKQRAHAVAAPSTHGAEGPISGGGNALVKTKGATRSLAAPAVPQEADSLHHPAALGGALAGVGGFRPALALAGILALARRVGGLAGAGALAGIDAGTLGGLGVGGGGERAGGEKSGGSRHESTLGHDGRLPGRRERRCAGCGRLSCTPIYGRPRGGDHPAGFTL